MPSPQQDQYTWFVIMFICQDQGLQRLCFDNVLALFITHEHLEVSCGPPFTLLPLVHVVTRKARESMCKEEDSRGPHGFYFCLGSHSHVTYYPKSVVSYTISTFLVVYSRDITLPTKVLLVKVMVFPVVMYGYESWTVKKAECQTVVLEKTLESPLDCKEIEPVHS